MDVCSSAAIVRRVFFVDVNLHLEIIFTALVNILPVRGHIDTTCGLGGVTRTSLPLSEAGITMVAVCCTKIEVSIGSTTGRADPSPDDEIDLNIVEIDIRDHFKWVVRSRCECVFLV